jgi:glycosyltransferase involved in cell wall biosynthesis
MIKRLLLIPALDDRTDLDKASAFKTMLMIAKGLIENGCYVYFIVPNNKPYSYSQEYIDSFELSKEYFQIIPTTLLKDQLQEVLFTDEYLRLFKLDKSPLLFDGIVTGVTGSSMILKRIMKRTYGYSHCDIPIGNYCTDLKLVTKNFVNEETIEVTEIINHFYDVALFSSMIEHSDFLSRSKNYLSPSFVNNLKYSVINFPINLEFYKSFRKEKRSKFTIAIAGRIDEPKKNNDKIINAWKNLRKRGIDIDLVIATGQDKIEINTDGAEVYYNQNGTEYIDKISDCHMFVCASDSEGTGLTYWEMICAGLTGLFKKAKWHTGLLPFDYEYYFSDKDNDLEEMILAMYNYRNDLKDIYEFISGNFNSKIIGEKIITSLSDSIKSYNNKLVDELLEKVESGEYKFKDLVSKLSSLTDKGLDLSKSGVCNKFDIWNLVRDKCIYNGEEPIIKI